MISQRVWLVDLQTLPITGQFVRTIALQTSCDANYGLAISPDSAHMVASHFNHTLSVHTLTGVKHIRTFGSRGAGKGQFDCPAKLCFSAAGSILVAERGNKRVQEVTLTGDHVRFIGVCVIDDFIWGIAANAELIVVGNAYCFSNNRIRMFDAVSGAFLRAFGDYGDAPGRVMDNCNGIRCMPDSRHIIVAENGNGKGRLSVFTLAGEFVRCIGEGELKAARDVEFADNGDVIVCDRPNHRICVYSADGSTLLRQWGGDGDADGKFVSPTALAMCSGHLYVLDEGSKRVQVFE